MKTKIVPIDELKFDEGNVRKRDARAEATLEASLKQFKPFRSVAVDGDLVTRAGNGTLKAAIAAGVTEVLLVQPDPGQLVAVQRDDLSPSQLVAYGIADNRTTDLSTFDDTRLVAVLQRFDASLEGAGPVGYTTQEREALAAAISAAEAAAGTSSAGDEDAGPRLHFVLVFEDVTQQDRWFEFLRRLAQTEGAAPTVGARIHDFLTAGGYGQ